MKQILILQKYKNQVTKKPQNIKKSPRHLPKKHRGENLGIKNSNKTDVYFFLITTCQ